ncbi:MAG: hypothetical protein KC503_07565 [Myxococcales bacterium]|nr:hypothetical protein [Myxococcales bacterium]
MARKRLGELLVEAGVIDDLQLSSALGEQRKYGRPLGRVLVEMGAVSEDAMVGILSQQLNIPAVQLNGRQLAPAALQQLDLAFCQRHLCVPFGYQDRGRFLDVAMADPTNLETFDQIRIKTRCNVRPYLAGPVAIDAAIRVGYTGVSMEEANIAARRATPTRADAGVAETYGAAPWPVNASMVELAGDTGGARQVDLERVGPVRGGAGALPGYGANRRARSVPTGDLPAVPQPVASPSSGQLEALRTEVAQLKALLERDEKVLRRLMGLLIDKGLCTRDELVARLNED